jgi:hypothetical protein
MPLRDHFHSPLNDFTSWEGFHGQWPAVIVQRLGAKLPARYVAEPRVHLGSEVEIDIATFDAQSPDRMTSETSLESGTATAIWAPAKPTLSIETEAPDSAAYEVRVYDLKRRRRLVAAIEIVSPANKDRPEHRRLFVAKCAAMLEQHVSVTIVDLVTAREFNLYHELLEFLGQSDSSLGTTPPPLYAVSCRWRPHGETHLLETWNHPLTVGQPLPTLPLWLTDTFAVPLELEESYEQTCRDLRIA